MPKTTIKNAVGEPRGDESARTSSIRRIPSTETQSIAFVLMDNSLSMEGDPIRELAGGLNQFVRDCRADPKILKRVQAQFDVFSNRRRTLKPAGPLDDGVAPPETIPVDSGTFLGEALHEELDDIEAVAERHRELGIPIAHLFLIVLSDGQPNGRPELLESAKARVRELVDAGRLSVFAIGVGDAADLQELSTLSQPRRAALRLRDVKDFGAFFRWLFESMVSASMTRVGEAVELPNPLAGPTNPTGWATT